jgi:hypothetical protein
MERSAKGKPGRRTQQQGRLLRGEDRPFGPVAGCRARAGCILRPARCDLGSRLGPRRRSRPEARRLARPGQQRRNLQERNSRSSTSSFHQNAEFACPQDRVEGNNCGSVIGACQSPAWPGRIFLKAEERQTCNIRWMNQDRVPINDQRSRDSRRRRGCCSPSGASSRFRHSVVCGRVSRHPLFLR